MTTIDDELQQAGSRLAALPVEVPELPILTRHRRRRLVAGAAAAVLVVAAAATAVGTRHDDRQRISAETTDVTVGLSRDALWPGEGREFDSPSDLGMAFATEILCWPDTEVITQPPDDPGGPRSLTLRNTALGREVVALAAPLHGNWTLLQVGDPAGITGHRDGRDRTRLSIPVGPPGTASVRWWVLADDREVSGEASAPTDSLDLPVPLERVDATLVLYLDEEGLATAAIGSGG
jgi:hypothetical protein